MPTGELRAGEPGCMGDTALPRVVRGCRGVCVCAWVGGVGAVRSRKETEEVEGRLLPGRSFRSRSPGTGMKKGEQGGAAQGHGIACSWRAGQRCGSQAQGASGQCGGFLVPVEPTGGRSPVQRKGVCPSFGPCADPALHLDPALGEPRLHPGAPHQHPLAPARFRWPFLQPCHKF